MADHKAEQILAAVLAKVTGLTTTGSRVTRGRVYDLATADLPALGVFLGPDAPRSDGGSSSFRYLDGDLTVVVEAYVKTASAQVDTQLNQIRKEVTIALQADVTQGLAFVLDTQEGAADPTLDGSGDKPAGTLRMEWVLRYRRLRTDPSQ